MKYLNSLKNEMLNTNYKNKTMLLNYLLCQGYRMHFNEPQIIARAYATAHLFTSHVKHIFENDLIVGSIIGKYADVGKYSDAEFAYADRVVKSYGTFNFHMNTDHFAPDYVTILNTGIGGTLEKIRMSKETHKSDADAEKKLRFLDSAEITMKSFSEMIYQYGDAAEEKASTLSSPQKENLLDAAAICHKIATKKPETFKEALQLVWLCHVSFLYEGRYAMALGRLDQYLYPFFRHDIDSGILTEEYAIELLSCTLYKIKERMLFGSSDHDGSDVVNIAVGGLTRDGEDASNRLSWIIMEAVKRCNIPGPNLSARTHKNTPDWFYDKALEVIGTGLGYPALMNDDATVPALARCGYAIEDCRDYSMVGCIEAFITGKQPPWADGRYNTPKYIELALNNGKCMQTNIQLGPDTGDAENISSMDEFINILTKQMEYGMYESFIYFKNENMRYNYENYSQPYLSCYCQDCIGRGLDINDGGTIYKSAFGMGCMGIATVADSLAAIEKVVFVDKLLTLAELRDILKADFNGYDEIRKQLLSAPKYGNNDDFVDKYAVWYVDIHYELFSKIKTRDGGCVYIAIASNTSNIPAGLEVAATPDGRGNGVPLSDAASPMRSMDKHGLTSLVNSTSKPDFTKVACGTVLNQKFSPATFATKEKRDKIKALLKVYFRKGGQEMQINSVSRDILMDAQLHPENYSDLVVRVSGFSAFYTLLSPAIQNDILERTENE